MDVAIERQKAGIFKFKGVTRVADQIACEADFMCTVRSVG